MIHSKMTIKQIRALPEFGPMRNAFIASATDFFGNGVEELTLEGLQEQHPTWNAADIVFGLNHQLQIARQGKPYVYSVYTPEQIAAEPAKARVSLVCHPAAQRTTETVALLLSGGAYGAVCTMVESMPVAARLNELGMDAYSLNYRTADAQLMMTGLMPAPLEDVAQALRFMKEQFGVDLNDTIVGGFSAGGNLAALWGAKHGQYGLPRPQLAMLVYPLISMENMPASPVRDFMCNGILGPGWDEAKMHSYSVHRIATQHYPKTYIVLAEDDDTVPPKDSRDMEQALTRLGVAHMIERAPSGGHGFGLGSATAAAGWVDRAVAFLNRG